MDGHAARRGSSQPSASHAGRHSAHPLRRANGHPARHDTAVRLANPRHHAITPSRHHAITPPRHLATSPPRQEKGPLLTSLRLTAANVGARRNAQRGQPSAANPSSARRSGHFTFGNRCNNWDTRSSRAKRGGHFAFGNRCNNWDTRSSRAWRLPQQALSPARRSARQALHIQICV